MNTRTLLVIVSLVLGGLPSTYAGTPTTSKEVPVKWLSADEAYRQLKAVLPELKDIVKSIQLDKNALTFNSAHPKAAEALTWLARFDHPSREVFIDATLSEVDANGDEKVISHPKFTILANQPAELDLKTNDGKKLRLKVKVLDQGEQQPIAQADKAHR